MKRLICIALSLCMILGLYTLTPSQASAAQLKITMNGKTVNPPSDQKPYITNGRTMVSLKNLGDVLKIPYTWNGSTRAITLNYSYAGASYKISLTIGSKTMIKTKTFNGKTTTQKKTLDTAPVIKTSRTYVPLGFITQSIDYLTTAWDGKNSTVKLTSNQLKITFDSNIVSPPSDQKPYITNGRTMVSVKNLGDTLKIPVTWDGKTNTVTVSYTYSGASYTIKLTIGSKTMTKTKTVSGKATTQNITLDTAPVIKVTGGNGRTYVPLGFITQSIEYLTTAWDSNTASVVLKVKTSSATPTPTPTTPAPTTTPKPTTTPAPTTTPQTEQQQVASFILGVIKNEINRKVDINNYVAGMQDKVDVKWNYGYLGDEYSTISEVDPSEYKFYYHVVNDVPEVFTSSVKKNLPTYATYKYIFEYTYVLSGIVEYPEFIFVDKIDGRWKITYTMGTGYNTSPFKQNYLKQGTWYITIDNYKITYNSAVFN